MAPDSNRVRSPSCHVGICPNGFRARCAGCFSSAKLSSYVIGHGQFLQRPAHAHVTGQALAAVGEAAKAVRIGGIGALLQADGPAFPVPTSDGAGNRQPSMRAFTRPDAAPDTDRACTA